MKLLIGYIKVVNSINEKIGKATSRLTLLLVVGYDVIARYLFDSSSIALRE
jgi:TRAP-type mannitol/chloroaromatic compound transport system permease small subunit